MENRFEVCILRFSAWFYMIKIIDFPVIVLYCVFVVVVFVVGYRILNVVEVEFYWSKLWHYIDQYIV